MTCGRDGKDSTSKASPRWNFRFAAGVILQNFFNPRYTPARALFGNRAGHVGKADRSGSLLRHFRLEPPLNHPSVSSRYVVACTMGPARCCSRTAPRPGPEARVTTALDIEETMGGKPSGATSDDDSGSELSFSALILSEIGERAQGPLGPPYPHADGRANSCGSRDQQSLSPGNH